MIVISKNAEIKLLEEMKNSQEDWASFQCFHLRLSALSLSRKELYEAFFRVLEAIPNSYTAHVYICNDKDAFILMRGFMQRQFMIFLDNLAQDLADPQIKDLVTSIDMQQNSGAVLQICAEKLSVLEKNDKHEAEEKQKSEHAQIVQEAFENVDAALIPDIAARRSARQNCSVMVIDDDQLSRTLVGTVLDKDFSMIFAKNGKEGMKMYVEHAPDVLFLDIGLPDISGHDILELLFQMDKDAYVIMFSGRTDKENIMKALDVGAQGFVGKPFTREKLYQYVEKSPFIQEKKQRISGVRKQMP